ncbi:aerobic glycerol-3-phosphate dehydrogenase [Insulibacter thermoxylanivorax]|uniref:Glycerol-3-phosphate dehydrogenase n=1 Tax=Insulibacter thermoxylanivorax TaxID=2749268 RepID=A0A916VFP5_9BACL|nr:glycerol-3-phosphate dehydrogenase/oxidase [Insulibacter thermoxylanivorax]GFR37879.1 aerobic glycerol-3-phosphate dehydrogenase [Insulibacter thermoxylanivorax]
MRDTHRKGTLAADRREEILERMAQEELDLLVIGGGITGAGIAWDAAVRGMSVGLIEMRDFAFGTSSRSTKLVHGGLRYLKQGEWKLVREVGRERKLLHKRLPHLIRPVPMLLPVYKGGTYGYYTSSLGIWLYDWLAGVEKSERRRMLDRKETLRLEPLLQQEGLRGAGLYYEYTTDDARLTIEIIKSAVLHGVLACNYVQAVDFLYKRSRLIGVQVQDQLSGRRYSLYARRIVNAAGPWVDHLRRLDQSLTGKQLRLTKGVHLVVDHGRLPIRQAVYFDAPDGRMIFAIPRGAKTYIGTTDTEYDGDPAEPRVAAEDAAYLLEAVNRVFPEAELAAADIESGWAGLRPLIHEPGKRPSEISRKDEIFLAPSGLISIAGGKLTGFRKMAKKVVNLVAMQLEEEYGPIYPPCTTDRIAVSGGPAPGAEDESAAAVEQKMIECAASLGISEGDARDLWSRYGVNMQRVLDLYREQPGSERQQDGQRQREDRLLAAEVLYCIDEEMTLSALDFLLRRTGWLLFDRKRAEGAVDAVIRVLARRLGWDEARCASERELVRKELSDIVQISRNRI